MMLRLRWIWANVMWDLAMIFERFSFSRKLFHFFLAHGGAVFAHETFQDFKQHCLEDKV